MNIMFDWQTLLLITVLLATLAAWIRLKNTGLPPGPRGWPLIGCMHVLSPDMCLILDDMGKKYGDVFSFYVGTRLTVVLNSAKAVRNAFIDQGVKFAGRPYPWVMKLVNVHEVINNGTYTEEWKQERKSVLNALRQFGYGSSSLEDKVQEEINTLMRTYINHGQKPVDPREHLPKTMANLIFSILINEHYSYDDPELAEKLKQIHRWQESVGEANLLDIFPILRFFPWKPMRRLKKVRDDITAIYRRHVREHKETFDPSHCRDVIDVYLKERGLHYDDERLVGLFFSFVGDAVDSLPEVMVWVVLFIAAYPEVQRKLLTEITSVTGGSRGPRLSDRPNLPYTEATFMETMRMSSFVPISEPHKPMEDTTLCGYRIPKESNVLANLYAVHMDPSLWDDPQTFKPERFLDSQGNLTKPEAYVPYSVGRRMCLGEQLSNKVLLLFTATLVQQFHIEFPEDRPPPSLTPQRWYVRKAHDFEVCFLPRT